MAYRCRSCGYLSLKWLGRCPGCGEWETLSLVEEEPDAEAEAAAGPAATPRPLREIPLSGRARWPTGLEEFDRILGGGVLPGSTVLLGGEPGIGKSTLLLEVAGRLARSPQPRERGPVLYVSGEEAPEQIKLRAERLGLPAPAQERLWVLGEQRLRAVLEAAREARASALIVDSIQTIYPHALKDGGPGLGTTQQVGEVAYRLAQLAKSQGIPTFLIGHITKGGEFAGPKAIEHLVDVALYLEGGREGDVRILRAVKNRYGSTEEIGVFRMGEAGLEEIRNPSEFFTERTGTAKPGSVVVPSLEGTRPILVEIQALVAASRAGVPQRRATGLDPNRVALLLAVIEKHLGLHIAQDDVYLNVAGGLSLRETATDLGVAAAVVSSYRNRALDGDTVVVGELGLSGEVRRVRKLKERLTEAARLGYARAVVPARNAGNAPDGLEILPAEELSEAMEHLGLF